MYFWLNFVGIILLILFVLVGVAFLTLLERKILGYVQDRKGPSKLGVGGVFQPLGDAVKLFNKETLVVYKSDSYFYFLCPSLSMILMVFCWSLMPVVTNIYYMSYSALVLFVVFSMSGYMILLVGWSSNSSFALMGSIRFISQSVSYEVSFILIIYVLMMLSESYSLGVICDWQIYLWNLSFLGPIFLVFFVSALFELNRGPADLIEGESELVSGFNVEYFGGLFALIFLGEYGMIILMSYVIVVIFSGLLAVGGEIVGVAGFLVMFVYMRGVLPRMRYDELMYLCWKVILPMVLNYLFFVFGIKFFFMII